MEELYRQNAKIVYHFLYRQCRDGHLAEDLTQETFLQAYRSIERYDGTCKLSVWLCQIAKHLLYRHWEKTKHEIPVDGVSDQTQQEGKEAASYRSIPPEFCYTGMPVLMLGCYFVITADTEPAVRAKARKTTGAASLLLTGYGVFLMFRSTAWIRKGVYPLGMQERQIGPFLDGLLLAIFFCQAVLFTVVVSLSLRTKRSYNLPLNFTLAGSFFCLAQRSMLSRMSDVEAFAEAGNRSMAVLLAEMAAVTLLLCVLEKRKQNAVPLFPQ